MFYDKNRRPIMRGDIIKLFHFIGARRKKYYMYKQAIDYVHRGGREWLECGHLALDSAETFFLSCSESEANQSIEIVQGYGENGEHFEDRTKKKQGGPA